MSLPRRILLFLLCFFAPATASCQLTVEPGPQHFIVLLDASASVVRKPQAREKAIAWTRHALFTGAGFSKYRPGTDLMTLAHFGIVSSSSNQEAWKVVKSL